MYQSMLFGSTTAHNSFMVMKNTFFFLKANFLFLLRVLLVIYVQPWPYPNVFFQQFP